MKLHLINLLLLIMKTNTSDLAKTIPNKCLSVISFDNFFTTPELIYHLRNNYGILSLGTVQENRLRNCPLLKEKEL